MSFNIEEVHACEIPTLMDVLYKNGYTRVVFESTHKNFTHTWKLTATKEVQ